jgi:glutaconate CoA-transferase subunit B
MPSEPGGAQAAASATVRGDAGNPAPASDTEGLILTVSRLLAGVAHVAVGASSPIPGAGALLARALSEESGATPMRLSILGSRRHNTFTNGGVEIFDMIAQGRIGAFFLGGGQIDAQANINLVGAGDYPTMDVRWPGSFGSAYLYHLVPRVILFREEHSPRTLVEKVDFVSAPGTSAPEVWRRGGPSALVTGKAVFSFDAATGRFRLESVHDGETPETVAAATGFAFDRAMVVAETPAPARDRLTRLRAEVAPRVATFYPEFAARVWGFAA